MCKSDKDLLAEFFQFQVNELRVNLISRTPQAASSSDPGHNRTHPDQYKSDQNICFYSSNRKTDHLDCRNLLQRTMAMSLGSRRCKRSVRICRSTSSSSDSTLSSIETVAEIDDLLIQILSFLPVKALLRFKCVSKHWLSLIADASFSSRTTSSKLPTVSGLFFGRYFHGVTSTEYEFLSLEEADHGDDNSVRHLWPPIESRTLKFADHPDNMIVLQSCNGLLLCQNSCSDRNYYIYNPTTKRNTLLPPINSLSDQVEGISIAFDPSKSPHYKVVCLRTCGPLSDLGQIEIYSSDVRLWRPSGPPFTLPPSIESGRTVFFENSVHWFSCLEDCSISFDIEREDLRFLPLPRLDELEAFALTFLGESGGHLYFAEQYMPTSSQFLVLQMEGDSSGWSRRYKVDLEPLAVTFPEIIETESYTGRRVFAYTIVGVIGEQTAEGSYIVLHIPNKVVRYNLKDKTFKKLRDLKPSDEHENPDFYGVHGMFQFVESLVCV